MVRVHSRAASVHASRAQSKAASRRNKKPYKVVFESVTQEKKKLRSAVSFNDRAPPGYTFIPVGSPELTERCKELCRRRGLEVHIVSAKPRNKAAVDPSKLGYHVHRLGYHFPNVVVDEAVEWLDIDIAPSRKRNTDGYTSKIAQGLENAGRKLGMAQNASAEQTEQQISITMKDLFPKIPEKALKAIVKHAFRKGSARVGSSDLPLARKVQLAVLAHVRHNYTDYDKTLKERSWHEARAAVERECLEKLLEWRGENDDGKIEMEDEFREVIILDDDEEDTDDTTSGSDHDSREASVEIISSQATARELEAPEPPETDWMRTHYRSYGHRLRIPQILRPRLPSRKRAASPMYPQPPPYVTDSGRAVAHTRPLAEETRYARPLGPPPDTRLLGAGGRVHYDVPQPPRVYPHQESRLLPHENNTYMRIVRSGPEHPPRIPVPHSQPIVQTPDIRPVTNQTRELDGRPLGPEDEVVPSIEKDDPTSTQPAGYVRGSESPIKRQRLEYISLQERSFMQAEMESSKQFAPSDQYRARDDVPRRQPSRVEAIDLTSSPRDPKSAQNARAAYAPRHRETVGPNQQFAPRVYSTGDTMQGLVRTEPVPYRRFDAEPVASRPLTASRPPMVAQRYAEPVAPGYASPTNGQFVEVREAERDRYRGPERDDLGSGQYNRNINAVPTMASGSRLTDGQVHQRPLPPKRNSGGELLELQKREWRQMVRGEDGLPPLPEPRPAEVRGYPTDRSHTVDSRQRARQPLPLERRRDMPSLAGYPPYTVKSPVRQRYDDVIVIDDSPTRPQAAVPSVRYLVARGHTIGYAST